MGKPIRSRWVVKAGSNMIVSGGPLLLRSWAHQIAKLRSLFGIEIIWVTSGAIASAKDRKQLNKKIFTLPEKQALSAIGQPLIMDLYNLALQSVGLLGAQVLLTSDDTKNPTRKKNLVNTLETLLKWGVTPILNENDAVVTDEIRFGDNDSLSAHVAEMISADRLVLMTDVNGLYDSDPRQNQYAKRLHLLKKVTPALLRSVNKSGGSSNGTGGMFTKLGAADQAQKAGIESWLVKGDIPSVLIEIANNKQIGTRIPARSNPKKRLKR